MSDEVEALIHPSADGKFWAEVVGLHGCYAQGENYSQIMTNLRDAHELCSASPSPAPPPVTLELGEGATASDLVAELAANGWNESAGSSSIHQLVVHPESGARLCVPASSGEALSSGYRAAVTKYLRGM